jgi:hypothetical protein
VTWRQVFYSQSALAAISVFFGFNEAAIVRSLKLVHPRLVVLLPPLLYLALLFSALAAPVALALALSKSKVRVTGRWFLMIASLFLSGYQLFALVQVIM